jgi:hypothetical protein
METVKSGAISPSSTMNDSNGAPIYNGPIPTETGNPIKLKAGTKNPPNPKPDEVFEAEPLIWGKAAVDSGNPPTFVDAWKQKKGFENKSTFFPTSWSKERIYQEIAFARANLKESDFDIDKEIWKGTSSNGIKIHMYINKVDDLPSPTADFGSAFPVL